MRFSYFFVPLVLVIALPIIMILSGYTWTFNDLGKYPFLEKLTNTGASTIGTVISVGLLLIIMWFYRKNKTLALTIAAYCFCALASNVIIKDFIKDKVQEPRPFVMQMAKTIAYSDQSKYFINLENAYQSLNTLNMSQTLISNQSQIAQNSKIPVTTSETNNSKNSTNNSFNPQTPFVCDSCLKHPNLITDLYYKLTTTQQQFFTNYFASVFLQNLTPAQTQILAKMAKTNTYSLPSGHYVLASFWIMIFFILAFNIRKWSFWIITGIVTVWGISIGASRVLLGYHYDHDILFSAIIVSVFVWLTFWLILIVYKILYWILNIKLHIFAEHQDPAILVKLPSKKTKSK